MEEGAMKIIGINRLMLNPATIRQIVEDALNDSFYSSTTKIIVKGVHFNSIDGEFEIEIEPMPEPEK
jgi:hypothetical protein